MFLSMGKDTYKVSLQEVFAANRQRLVDRLVGVLLREEREEPAKLEVDIVPPNTSNNHSHNNNNNDRRRRRRRRCIVYLQGGASETRNDSDHEPLFRQESYFWYLTGVKEPDCAAMIDIQIPSGLDDDISSYQTTLLIPELPAEYATVMGRIKKPMEWKDLYQVDHVRFTNETNRVLEEAFFHTSKNTIVNSNGIDINGNGSVKTSSSDGSSTPMLLLLQGNNSDSGKDYKAPPMEHFSTKIQKVINTDLLFHVLAEARVLKSAAELALLQHVTQVTSFAHSYVMRNMKVDMMEYQAESLFRHYCYYNYGCRLVSYTPICGCGPNAAILHYGHAGEPNARQIVHGDICLFDMGAEYYGYGSDVTCSFPISGQFSDLQRPIYQAVLNAQVAVYQMMKPGVSWVACHKAAEMEILKVLVDIGLVGIINDGGDHKRTLEELVEMRLCAVFMPHGLGHFIGIDTHDVGGYLPGHPERIMLPGLKKLRTARVLEASMTLTVEPGCYFIDHLLDQAMQDGSPLKPYLNETRVDEYRGFGGVRLEDVVVVTETGIINYTLCPRTMDEVEAVMAGGKWPPLKDTAPELKRLALTNTTTLTAPLPAPPSI